MIDEESTSKMGTVNLPSRVQYTYLIQHYSVLDNGQPSAMFSMQNIAMASQ